MGTVIVSPELLGAHPCGGIGAFTSHWALLLRQSGFDVSVIYTGPLAATPAEVQAMYASDGVDIAFVPTEAVRFNHWNYHSFVRVSEAVASLLTPECEVAYFQDWNANALTCLRARQFREEQSPLCAVVMHGPTAWILDASETLPSTELDVERCFAERYVAEHADCLLAPSRYMLEYLRGARWRLPEDTRVLGLPFLPDARITELEPGPACQPLRRIVYLGSLERRQGIWLFAEALERLRAGKSPALTNLSEIVLLGQVSVGESALDELLSRLQAAVPAASIVGLHGSRGQTAVEYLAEHHKDSLVVAASLADNLPCGVIEASLVPGLNLLATDAGGHAEILGEGAADQLVEPRPSSLADALERWLETGTRDPGALASYHWRAANERWLETHDELVRKAAARRTSRRTMPPAVQAAAGSVDVCMAYHNQGEYLPSALRALARQTTDHFELWVVNDGSTDPAADRVFAEERRRYTDRKSWHFVDRKPNAGLCETRNYAASLGQNEYLLFTDSDNVATPNMVERFRDAMRNSDLDCLTCFVYRFEGSDAPFLRSPPGLLADGELWAPPGPCLELGMFRNCFGDANFAVRRAAFEALGGFRLEVPADRFLSFEDWEFLARAALSGYRLDVIPEILLFYRKHEDSLSSTTNEYQAAMRALRTYRRALDEVGLGHLVPWLYQMHHDANTRRVHTATGGGNLLNLSARPPLSLDHVFTPERRQDAAWIAENVPWTKLLEAFGRKLRKRIARLSPG